MNDYGVKDICERGWGSHNKKNSLYIFICIRILYSIFKMPPRARLILPPARLAMLAAPAPPGLPARRARAQDRHDLMHDQRNEDFRLYERHNPGLLAFDEMTRLPAALLPPVGHGAPAHPLEPYCANLFMHIEGRIGAIEAGNGVAFGPRAWIRIGLHSMWNNYFISTPMLQMGDFTARSLLRMFRGQGNEDDQDDYDDMMEAEFLSIVAIANPDGSGKYSVRYTPEDELFYTGFNGKILIKSYAFENDHMCAQRALVLLLLKQNDPSAFKRLNRPVASKIGTAAYNEMRQRAVHLSAQSGVNINAPVNFEDLKKLSQVLSQLTGKQCHIIVVDAQRNMEIVYRTLNVLEQGQEHYMWFTLVLRNNHYDAAPRIHKIMHGQKNFCFCCFKTYNNKHICSESKRCILCNHTTDHTLDGHLRENKFCHVCFRNFSGEECFENHKKTKVCQTTWKCQKCLAVFQRPKNDKSKPTKGYNTPEKHHCDDIWCMNCRDYTPKQHECFVQKLKEQKLYEKYVFADFETDQSSGEHVVNLAVTIEFDGTEWPVFYNIHDWVQHMLLPLHKGKTFIFHNGRGFDFHPIFNELMLIGRCVKPVMTGRKVIFMNVPDKLLFSNRSGRRFIDSVNFLPMPLKAFSTTFDLKASKGFYPHYFNTQKNAFYVGDVPNRSFYGYDQMNDKDKKEFDQWYAQECIEKKGIWSNRDELLSYCKMDVVLLKEGCMKFRKLVMESVDNHDPFLCQTLSGSAMTIFKTLFLEDKTIAALKVNVARELRSAFNGGRTEAFKLYKKCDVNERIAYVDFTSLYPYCNAKCLYPLGHPVIIDEPVLTDCIDMINNIQVLAVLCVDVVCPQTLYCPLLHSQDKDGMLMFDLRPKLEVKYTSLELRKALQLGYEIITVHKVWLWEETKIGLFAEYMKRFLKIKQQAAGWPSKEMSENDKKSYMSDFEKAEGIVLDTKLVSTNDGLYKMAKLYLNSLWGKFAQRNPDMFDRTDIIHDTEQGVQEFNCLRSEGRIKDCYVVNEKTCLVKSKPATLPSEDALGSINITVGIFTTAHARLKLYNEFLEPCKHRLLYCDTDSCIFYYNIHEEPSSIIKLGNYLGDPTSEVGDKSKYDNNEWIEEFVSGGPKHYAYKTNKGKCMIKVKGLNLKKQQIANSISFEVMKQIVLSPHDHALVFHSKEIRINPEHELINAEVQKTYQLNFTKRKIGEMNTDTMMMDTSPWKENAELVSLKKDRKLNKRKRDKIETGKGWPVYFVRLEESTSYFYVCSEKPSNYIAVVYGFQCEKQSYDFQMSISVDECKTCEDVFAIISSKVKRDWIIDVKVKTSYFDTFEGCRIIKHIFQ